MLGKGIFKKPRVDLEGEVFESSAKKNQKPAVPDALCLKCHACKAVLFLEELKENDSLCPRCGAYFRMGARGRLKSVCDEGSFTELFAAVASSDPLSFPGYGEKLKKAREKSGEPEAVVCGMARVGGVSCALFAMEPDFMLGSMGTALGEKVTLLFEEATRLKLPVIGFTVSGGARMQEGILSLMQMAKTGGAVKMHSDAGLLYVCVLTDPTTGGVTASFAMQGDILLAEPKALIGFAGPRVIEQTMRQKLPDRFQSAEFLLERGFLDAIVERKAMKRTLETLLKLHQKEAAV
ncbi:MAG TPA: acetyl-CoA carboxylase, carboxyltransferase subunit beta [Clostridia bacterium]|nr:acetyl-CoA carboxylase, carboxyltransferase subunit beta [Clostridia bacterium]